MEYYIKVLKNYAVFEGRARRKEYWMFFLFNVIVSVIIAVLEDVLLKSEILGNVYSLAVLIPSLAVGVRRMHDVGKSGWYLLIPIYNFILAVTEGDAETNEYGPNPKLEGEEDFEKEPEEY